MSNIRQFLSLPLISSAIILWNTNFNFSFPNPNKCVSRFYDG